MSVTGIFFIPSSPHEPSPVQHIVENLTFLHNPQPAGVWRLEHRLFRETTSLLAGPDERNSSSLRYLQVLQMSQFPDRSYIAVTPNTSQAPQIPNPSNDNASAEGMTICAMPSGSSAEEMMQLIVTKMGALWTRKQGLQVAQGYIFEVEDYKIRLGDIKQPQNGHVRGCVIDIEWAPAQADKGENNDIELDVASGQAAIRSFWQGLDVPGAKEFINVPGLGKGDFDLVRQYLEMLRL
ncbi:MAG: hypothetical protein M1834_000574 [Cirrosporium novae-zelandiae]|nr:MAG: hypothetical protein M1834_000574 [Cirrosporium novae-zelandiae]